MKPIACAVHPIGRVIDLASKKSIYIRQSGGCSGESGGRTWTLNEWLDAWGLKELDEPSLAWNLMAGGVAMVMHDIKTSNIDRDTIWILCCFPLNNCYKFMGFHPKSVRDFEEGI